MVFFKKIFYKLTGDTLTLITVEWYHDFKYCLNYEFNEQRHFVPI